MAAVVQFLAEPQRRHRAAAAAAAAAVAVCTLLLVSLNVGKLGSAAAVDHAVASAEQRLG